MTMTTTTHQLSVSERLLIERWITQLNHILEYEYEDTMAYNISDYTDLKMQINFLKRLNLESMIQTQNALKATQS